MQKKKTILRTAIACSLLMIFIEENIKKNLGLNKKQLINFKIYPKLLINNPVNKSQQPFHPKAPQQHQHLVKQVNPRHLHAFLLKKNPIFVKNDRHHC